MDSWNIAVCARYAGSSQVGLLESKVHATNARHRGLLPPGIVEGSG